MIEKEKKKKKKEKEWKEEEKEMKRRKKDKVINHSIYVPKYGMQSTLSPVVLVQ